MADHIIDTNVLLVASAAHPHSPFGDSDLPRELQEAVFEWLAAFRRDSARTMVWDELWRIYDEYRRKLTDQDYGLQVVTEKMATARFVAVGYDGDGAAVLPAGFAAFDPSDRKFLAALLADGGASTLVNATDTDWLEIEAEIAAAGRTVQHLVEDWLRVKYAENTGRL
ncbi:MAG: hypothetical protein HYV63_01080 [Candidatus Schekmanbacteria bacterium]|nr:hypothetical protein [Candidatus Schekmanbacteria bacterium]